VALLRAIAEAAQARLSVIAGVRDDIGPEMYGRSDDPAELEAWWRSLSAGEGRQRFDRVPDARPLDPGAETSFLMGSLARAGLASVIWIDLSPPEIEAIVVGRVIIPGLEPPTEALCMPGPRAKAAMARSG
jgi:ribosomal protein S12 methylthiotransferase accessory factor